VRKLTLIILLKLALLQSMSCQGLIIKSYDSLPPMDFKDIPYPWDVKYMELRSGVKIAYIDVAPRGGGNGQTIIFIHGLGSYLRFWEEQINFFSEKGYRVLALDLPGYGKSEKPATFEYTPDNFGDVVLEFISKLGINRPILNGHSMGGQTALSFAIRYPDKLSGLVLTASAGFEQFTRREQLWFKSVFTDPRIFRIQSEYDVWRSINADNFYTWNPKYSWLVEYRVRLAKGTEFDQYGYAQIKSVWGLAKNNFVMDNANLVKTPTLIIFGEQDALIPNRFLHGGFTRDIFESAQKKIPNSKLVGLDQCGHTIQLDCSERYNKEVLSFLSTSLR